MNKKKNIELRRTRPSKLNSRCTGYITADGQNQEYFRARLSRRMRGWG